MRNKDEQHKGKHTFSYFMNDLADHDRRMDLQTGDVYAIGYFGYVTHTHHMSC